MAGEYCNNLPFNSISADIVFATVSVTGHSQQCLLPNTSKGEQCHFSSLRVFGSAFTLKLLTQSCSNQPDARQKIKPSEETSEVSWHRTAKEPNFISLALFDFLSVTGPPTDITAIFYSNLLWALLMNMISLPK